MEKCPWVKINKKRERERESHQGYKQDDSKHKTFN